MDLIRHYKAGLRVILRLFTSLLVGPVETGVPHGVQVEITVSVIACG